MATDTLSGSIQVIENFTLSQTFEGNDTGTDRLKSTYNTFFTDGSGDGQASCWLSATADITTSTNTISLADSSNPFGGLSTAVPTADPEGLKLRLLVIKNNDATNYVTLGITGCSFPVTFITGNTIIRPGGVFVLVAPNGTHVLNDGSDDEISLRANTSTCNCTVDVVYG